MSASPLDVDATTDARAAGVDRVLFTLLTVALSSAADDAARVYLTELSDEARAAVAELIKAAARVHSLNHTQGVTEDEWELASAALDAALDRMGGSQ